MTAGEDGFSLLSPETGDVRLVARVEAERGENRMNDGKVDPAGRFWAGTMAHDEEEGAGSLYRMDTDHTVHRVVAAVTISNGIDWSPDGRTMYYIDTATRRVDQMEFDNSTGTVRSRRPLITLGSSEGYPDGMTVDSDGYLWIALFDGWGVQRYAPDGRSDRRIDLPAAQVTSVAFGGDDLDELFITTGQENFPAGGKRDQPHAGSVFRCRPGVKGRLGNRFGQPSGPDRG